MKIKKTTMYRIFDGCVYQTQEEAESALIEDYLIPRFFRECVEDGNEKLYPYKFTKAVMNQDIDFKEIDALIIGMIKLRYANVDVWDIQEAIHNYEDIMDEIEDENQDSN